MSARTTLLVVAANQTNIHELHVAVAVLEVGRGSSTAARSKIAENGTNVIMPTYACCASNTRTNGQISRGCKIMAAKGANSSRVTIARS